jgi:hypothetical protein
VCDLYHGGGAPRVDRVRDEAKPGDVVVAPDTQLVLVDSAGERHVGVLDHHQPRSPGGVPRVV